MAQFKEKYASAEELVREQTEALKSKIRSLSSSKSEHYKFWIYSEMNPNLSPSPFLNRIDIVGKMYH